MTKSALVSSSVYLLTLLLSSLLLRLSSHFTLVLRLPGISPAVFIFLPSICSHSHCAPLCVNKQPSPSFPVSICISTCLMRSCCHVPGRRQITWGGAVTHVDWNPLHILQVLCPLILSLDSHALWEEAIRSNSRAIVTHDSQHKLMNSTDSKGTRQQFYHADSVLQYYAEVIYNSRLPHQRPDFNLCYNTRTSQCLVWQT